MKLRIGCLSRDAVGERPLIWMDWPARLKTLPLHKLCGTKKKMKRSGRSFQTFQGKITVNCHHHYWRPLLESLTSNLHRDYLTDDLWMGFDPRFVTSEDKHTKGSRSGRSKAHLTIHLATRIHALAPLPWPSSLLVTLRAAYSLTRR